MGQQKMDGRDLAMHVLMGWALGLAAKTDAPLAGLHQILVQEITSIADDAGQNSEAQQLVVAEATQVLDDIFVVAARVQQLAQQ